MSRIMVAAVLAVSAVCWVGCDDNWANSDGGGSGSFTYEGKTVDIGGKTWMAENLNVSAKDSRCYNNNSSNCDTYGRLYTWSAAKSACQSVGWRLPTNAEWDALVSAAGGSSIAAKALKSTSGWNDWANNGDGTDSYGFSALPGGWLLNKDGTFRDYRAVLILGYWWTATEYDAGNAYFRRMYSIYNEVYGGYTNKKEYGFSARCVKDL